MIEELIKTGEELRSQVKPGGKHGQMISGIEFETWAAKTIFFLEKNFPKSAMTEKAIDKNKTLNSGSYHNYEFLLATLHAAKDMLEEKEKEDKEALDFFSKLNN
ncbi:hypothetical protein M4D52_13985 [Paenibacillus lactis]|uniref:hypothetical protein n=1 Tax=Paenibacillus lactis TaxID=228574 RepID=UPI0020425A29|nr:hypothetical protein [Paenibacillus lactis]MCM3494545.1 hypothetical protein [Paenibacillus lactis]